VYKIYLTLIFLVTYAMIRYNFFLNFPKYKQQARLIKNVTVLLGTLVRKRVRLKTCCCRVHERLHRLKRNQLLYTVRSVKTKGATKVSFTKPRQNMRNTITSTLNFGDTYLTITRNNSRPSKIRAQLREQSGESIVKA
jgi:hypothetical protein